jgi:hypothetical protein
MKSVLTKRNVKQIWLGYMIAGYVMIAGGLFTHWAATIKGLTGVIRMAASTSATVMILYGLVLINHTMLLRGQSEIKKSINELKEKIDALK